MTAKEMFEKLGYEQDKNITLIEYYNKGQKEKYKNGKEKKYYVYGSDKHIIFDLQNKTFIAYSSVLLNDYEDSSREISIEELQAINKQVKELGWNK